MSDPRGTSNRAALWLRWIARVLGALVVAFCALVGIGNATGGDDPWTWMSTVLVVLIAAAVLSIALSWWQEGLGGLLVVACGVALGIFAAITAAHSPGLAMLMAGGPLVVVGALFLGSRWLARRGRR